MKSKKEMFEEAVAARRDLIGWDRVPDGEYHLSHTVQEFGRVAAHMKVEDGSFIVNEARLILSGKNKRKQISIEFDKKWGENRHGKI